MLAQKMLTFEPVTREAKLLALESARRNYLLLRPQRSII